MDWMPTTKQIEALERTEFEILYGGARGGGKTDAGMAFLLYHIGNPRFRGLVIRRNADDLRDWIDRATRFFARSGGVKIGTPTEFKFPSGAIIRTGHLKDDDAFSKYQGHEYQIIVIEELTQIAKEKNYLMLIASCRSSIPEIKPQVFCTTNPGGAGHKWVKARFIDVAYPGVPYIDPITGRSRIFIQAKVQDNPHLMKADPGYIRMLEGLPAGLREAWRDGSWEEIEIDGAYYSKQFQEIQRKGMITELPAVPNIPVYTFWDLGISDAMSIWFIQLIGNDVRWIDYYENTGEGLPHYIEVVKSKPYMYADHYAPHDIQVKELTSGMSRLEIARNQGVNFKVVDNIPVSDGIDALRIILGYSSFDARRTEEGVYALKNYHKEWSERMNAYKDEPKHDWTSHAADAARYAAVTINKLRRSLEKPTYGADIDRYGTAYRSYYD